MAIYSAVKGSDAVIYVGGQILCTAKSCEIITERELHEVYECFSIEPSAIVKGKEQYRVILESVVFQNFNVNFLAWDNISVEVFMGEKSTVLDNCYFNIQNKKFDKDSVVEKVEFLAKRRTERVVA